MCQLSAIRMGFTLYYHALLPTIQVREEILPEEEGKEEGAVSCDDHGTIISSSNEQLPGCRSNAKRTKCMQWLCNRHRDRDSRQRGNSMNTLTMKSFLVDCANWSANVLEGYYATVSHQDITPLDVRPFAHPRREKRDKTAYCVLKQLQQQGELMYTGAITDCCCWSPD